MIELKRKQFLINGFSVIFGLLAFLHIIAYLPEDFDRELSPDRLLSLLSIFESFFSNGVRTKTDSSCDSILNPLP